MKTSVVSFFRTKSITHQQDAANKKHKTSKANAWLMETLN
jgi:hypothetical protein